MYAVSKEGVRSPEAGVMDSGPLELRATPSASKQMFINWNSGGSVGLNGSAGRWWRTSFSTQEAEARAPGQPGLHTPGVSALEFICSFHDLQGTNNPLVTPETFKKKNNTKEQSQQSQI